MVYVLVGEKGSGKTTLANKMNLPIYSFASPVKQATEWLFEDLYEEYVIDFDKETIRPFYVLLANWARENIDPNIWVTKLMERTEDIEDFVIDDCRFKNELSEIQKHYGDEVISIYLEPFNGKPTDSNELHIKELKGMCDVILTN